MAIRIKVIPSGAGEVDYEVIDQSTNTIRLTAISSSRKYTFEYWLVDDSTTEVTNNPYDYTVGEDDVLFTAYFSIFKQPLSLYDDKQGHVGVCVGSLGLDARDKFVSELDAVLRNTEFREGATVTVVDDSDPNNIQTITKPAYKVFSTDEDYVAYVRNDDNYINTIRTMRGDDYSDMSEHDPNTLFFLTTLPNDS